MDFPYYMKKALHGLRDHILKFKRRLSSLKARAQVRNLQPAIQKVGEEIWLPPQTPEPEPEPEPPPKPTIYINQAPYPLSLVELHPPAVAEAFSSILSVPEVSRFPQFSLLPTELRLLVWTHALPLTPSTSRHVVEVQYISPTERFRTSASPLPSTILGVTHEARSAAISAHQFPKRRLDYKPSDAYKYHALFSSKRVQKCVLVAPAYDTVFFRRQSRGSWHAVFMAIRKDELELLESIAFEGDMALTGPRTVRLFANSIYRCTRLKEVVFLWNSNDSQISNASNRSEERAKTFEGRGVHVVQPEPTAVASPPSAPDTDGDVDAGANGQSEWDVDYGGYRVDQVPADVSRLAGDVAERWEKDGKWKDMGRQPPKLKLRHWCFNVRLGEEFGAGKSTAMAEVARGVKCEMCRKL